MDKNDYDEKVIDAWCSLPLENIYSFEEIKEAMLKIWERDMAFQQLENAGMTFGKKIEEESET